VVLSVNQGKVEKLTFSFNLQRLVPGDQQDQNAWPRPSELAPCNDDTEGKHFCSETEKESARAASTTHARPSTGHPSQSATCEVAGARQRPTSHETAAASQPASVPQLA
jgi:hypothetical protein